MKIVGNTVGMGLPKPNMKQTDPTKGDYIKGKPGEMDAIEIAAIVGLVSPLADDNGSVFTDENGAIYSL